MNSQSGDQGASSFGNLANLIKVTQFKNTGQLTRVHANEPSREERRQRQEESKVVMSTQNLEQVPAEEEKKGTGEEENVSKDGFVIVDNSYMDNVSE